MRVTMTREEFIEFLGEHGIPFTYDRLAYDKYDGVYVFSKKEYNLKKTHPRKYKDLYVPYIRVSDFGYKRGRVYTRENGLVGYKDLSEVLDICLKYGEI